MESTDNLECAMQEIMININKVLRNGLSKFASNTALFEDTSTSVLNLPIVKKIIYGYEDVINNNSPDVKCDVERLTAVVLNLSNEVERLKVLLDLKQQASGEKEEHISLKIEETVADVPINKQIIQAEITYGSNTKIKDPVASDDEEEASEDEDEDEDEDEEEEEDEDEEEASEEEAEEEAEDEAEDEAEEAIEAEEAEEASEAEEAEAEEEAEDKSVETEASEAEDEEDDEEVFEIEIDDVTYFATDEENGILYEVDKNGDPGKKVGIIKDGEPEFL